jgi:glycosyltransferase involved in cell wall biosynthesis
MEDENFAVPRITVISVVYNAETSLEATMLSVLAQDWPQLEYLVIDGGSTDGTLDIIRRHSARLGGWVSERDRGIYDAMNKGIRMAKGKWILFLNAGDRFVSPDVLTRCMQAVLPGDGVIFGDCIILYAGFSRLMVARGAENIAVGLPSTHQCMLFYRELAIEEIFDITEGLAADFGMVARLVKKGVQFRYVHIPMVLYQAGGISDVRRLSALVSMWRISRKNFGWSWNTSVHFVRNIIFEILKKSVRSVIGDRLMDRMRFLKYRNSIQHNGSSF